MTSYPDPDGFEEWNARIPQSLKGDPIWRTPAYRYGVWLSDLAAIDTDALFKQAATRRMADQLLRAVQAISSNLSEGYGCTTGRERARYYSYALSSAREAYDWYFKAREHLREATVAARHDVLSRIMRILTAVIPRERADDVGWARRKTRQPRPREDGGSR